MSKTKKSMMSAAAELVERHVTQWHVPPSSQGQMVEYAYGVDDGGNAWSRVYDRSDRSTSYESLGEALEEWQPWHRTPIRGLDYQAVEKKTLYETLDDILDGMKSLEHETDTELAHSNADDLLVQAVQRMVDAISADAISAGVVLKQIVAAYARVRKWYA